MGLHENIDGVAYTASDSAAVDAYERFISAYLGFRPDTMDRLGEVLAIDPDMPMAHISKGFLLKLLGTKAGNEMANAAVMDAGDRLDAGNARERTHADALRKWLAGDMDGATAAWERVLVEAPTDALALRLSHFTHFYSGDGRRIRDSVARVLPDWSEDHRNYGFVQGMYAFGLEESREYGEAEKWGRAAVEKNPADAWSVHSVAHVLEMTGRANEGIDFVNQHEADWSTVNNFRFHLFWHRCLYHLELGQHDQVLAVYDSELEKAHENAYYLDICNSSSLLWRLECWGVDVGNRWAGVRALAEDHVEDDDLIFVSLHYLMAMLSHGDQAGADDMVDRIAKWAEAETTQGSVTRDIGLTVAEALRDHRRGNYAACVNRMLDARYRMDALGGSMAQRDVFEMVMFDAARRAGEPMLAGRLLRERAARKPHSPWAHDALEGLAAH